MEESNEKVKAENKGDLAAYFAKVASPQVKHEVNKLNLAVPKPKSKDCKKKSKENTNSRLNMVLNSVDQGTINGQEQKSVPKKRPVGRPRKSDKATSPSPKMTLRRSYWC